MAGRAKKIVLAIDGSIASRNAARYAFKLSRALDNRITCISAVGTPPGLRKMNPALVAIYLSEGEKHAKKCLDEVEDMARQEKMSMNCEVIIGTSSVPTAIIEYAKKCDADFIVMGARGKGARKLLLGSVANAVVSHAGRPVLLVR